MTRTPGHIPGKALHSRLRRIEGQARGLRVVAALDEAGGCRLA